MPEYYNTPEFNYNLSNNYGNQPGRPRVNVFESIIVLIGLIGVIVTFIFGFVSQHHKNQDEKRANDISNVIIALDNFYLNSSVNPSSRVYPKVTCSSDLNEVDFEFSLREQLTGKRIELDAHEYIKPDQFPTDNAGKYSKTLSDRKLPYRCEKNISKNQTASIYEDNFPSCNFSSSQEKYKKCYIYTSSNNGDTFEIGYYSEVSKSFITYRKFRNSPIERRS